VIQVLGGSDKLLPTLTELAGALGLTTRRNQPANRQRLGIGETHDNNRRICSGDTGTVRTASPRGDYRSRC
jgi:hypothetical protein